jgi:hypothetical protein
MKRSESMLTRAEEYLRYRRALGYALRIEGRHVVFGKSEDRQTAALTQLTGILWRTDRVPPVKERGGSAFGPVRNMFESRFFATSESNIKFM